ncbi:hypothetical protein CY34DRAFT_107633 [Suillus luteus UH-Slu-Lm8-n1]|uniref:Uncharacterized protein n=1 Tax=Suillus luteus UH-Slu-Lm8-n1 TaxID=930992 RepID=A0A0D0AG49_9AGAM|nr:hypothetical protein CY34DRAFT_107633 [Suillus luteus UH-Slu-Lm8-n1]
MSGNAVKRFRGRVRERCVELMFKSLDQGATFHHATEHFIAEPSSRETGAQSFILLVARCLAPQESPGLGLARLWHKMVALIDLAAARSPLGISIQLMGHSAALRFGLVVTRNQLLAYAFMTNDLKDRESVL